MRQKTSFENLVEVKKGEYITKKDAKEGPYPVILGGREPAYYIDRFNHTGRAIVISRSGASAGFVSRWNEPIFITDGFLIEPRENVDYDFTYYALKNCEVLLQGRQSGAAIPHVTPRLINSLEVMVPPLNVQQKISRILSAYDDLIENNQRQIKLLEEAAQRQYKEWFVDLRFPGHEHVPIVDGLPEGWSEKSMEEIADYLNGYAFKPSDWKVKGKPIIKIKELNEGITKDTPRNPGDDIPEKYIVRSGDIVFSWSATLAAKIWDAEEGLLNQHLFKVTPNSGIGREFVLQSIRNALKEFDNLTTGSTMKHIQRGKLSQVFVKVPSHVIMEKFELLADEAREQILLLNRKINLLTEARDRLLPKLMSGEIEV